MVNHTQETLDDLRLKGDVKAIAEERGLSGDGTRKEITDRILAAQASPEAVEAPEPDEAPEPEVIETSDPPEELKRAHDDDGKFIADDDATQPNEAYAPPKPQKVSERAKLTAGQIIAGYISVAAYTKEVEKSVLDALAAGKQPCIVEGKGNARFELEIYDKLFSRSDLTSDVPAKRDGVVMNIARRLADANLYPHD